MSPTAPPYEPEDVPAADAATMERIGRLRVAVWTDEGSLAPALFPGGVWADACNPGPPHWGARDARGGLVAAARLSVDARAAESPDGDLCIQRGLALPEPVANIARLVVSRA